LMDEGAVFQEWFNLVTRGTRGREYGFRRHLEHVVVLREPVVVVVRVHINLGWDLGFSSQCRCVVGLESGLFWEPSTLECQRESERQ